MEEGGSEGQGYLCLKSEWKKERKERRDGEAEGQRDGGRKRGMEEGNLLKAGLTK